MLDGRLLDVGIITAPRTPHYLGESLDSFFGQFQIKPFVFCEPSTKSFHNQAKTICCYNATCCGYSRNWFNGLESIVMTRNSDWIMMCEDDILWYPHAGNILEELIFSGPEPGLYSLYCSQYNANEAGLWKFTEMQDRRGGLCGALALVLHRNVATKLLNGQQIFWTESEDGKYLDYGIAETVKQIGYRRFIHTPTLVHHMGYEHSTILPDGHSKHEDVTRKAYDPSCYASKLKLFQPESIGEGRA